MKAALFAIVLAAALTAGPVAAGSWGSQGYYPGMQAAQKGRPGPGAERGERAREFRQERREERREQLTEEERRALHRDLDKANRELYRRRFQR